MKIAPPWQGTYVNRVSQKSAHGQSTLQVSQRGRVGTLLFSPRKSTNVMSTATQCPRECTKEPPVPSKLSPDSTQHSEQQHVTCDHV